MPVPQIAEVHSLGPRLCQQCVSTRPYLNAQRVEVGVVDDSVAGFLQPAGERPRLAVYAAGYAPQPVRPVIDREHARHYGRQDLSRADVARSSFSFDVLFAGLQGHAQGGLAADIRGDANDAPRYLPLELGSSRQKGRMRAAVPHRHAKALRAPDGRIGPKFPGGPQQTQGEQIDRHTHQRLMGMSLSAEIGVFVQGTV